MTDIREHPREIATRLRAEAALADRPGQMARLEAEADAVEALLDWNEKARILLENVRVQGERADKYLDRICGNAGDEK